MRPCLPQTRPPGPYPRRPGNNGGDGLVAARHLANRGIAVTILLLADRSKFRDAAATQLAIVEAMKLPIETLSPTLAEFRDWLVDADPDDLLIDALFGTGLTRPLEERAPPSSPPPTTPNTLSSRSISPAASTATPAYR